MSQSHPAVKVLRGCVPLLGQDGNGESRQLTELTQALPLATRDATKHLLYVSKLKLLAKEARDCHLESSFYQNICVCVLFPNLLTMTLKESHAYVCSKAAQA